MNRAESLLSLLNDLDFFYTDLNRLIVSYDYIPDWETTAENTWKLEVGPYGILALQQQIYQCFPVGNLIIKYNLKGEIIQKITSLKGPAGIDFDKKNSLYIAGKTNITIVALQNIEHILSSWTLPAESTWNFRGIKVNEDILYLTVRNPNYIFMCKSDNGKVLNKFGTAKESTLHGEFHQPSGVTVNTKYLYVCDCGNNRVQKLTKDKGLYVSQWNECYSPKSIFYDELEKIFYIGDDHNIHLVISTPISDQGGDDQGTIEMKCIQKLGDEKGGHQMNRLNVIFGLCKMNDLLYVSDSGNTRIQVFRRKEW